MLRLQIFLLLACFLGTNGQFVIVDTTDVITADELDCLTKNGVNFLMTRIYDPSGAIDENGLKNLQIKPASYRVPQYVYVSPCLKNCANSLTLGSQQANTIVNAIQPSQYSHNGMAIFYFIQIDPTQPWSSNTFVNELFIQDMLNTFSNSATWDERPTYVGIMASQSAYKKVLGDSVVGSNLLWVDWNGKQPCGHQYAGSVSSNKCVPGKTLNYSFFNYTLCDTNLIQAL